MKTKVICLCKYAIIDKYKANLSIVNLINSIKAPQLPLMIPEACLVLVSEKQENEPKKTELELFVKLNKKLLIKQKAKIEKKNGSG